MPPAEEAEYAAWEKTLTWEEYTGQSIAIDRADATPDEDGVRRITICDTDAALIERRSYKAPMAPQEAYAALVGMGAKLDADLLRAFGPVVVPG